MPPLPGKEPYWPTLQGFFEVHRFRCPSCRDATTPAWDYGVDTGPHRASKYEVIVVCCGKCGEENVLVRKTKIERTSGPPAISSGTATVQWVRRVHPTSVAPRPFRQAGVQKYLKDYSHACAILEPSPPASACMSRRCLQSILYDQGYTQRNPVDQIKALLKETDPDKILPKNLRKMVDAVREFGNFGAHPVTDETTLQTIEVEDEEAEWCIQIVENLLEHYFEAEAEADRRVAAANKKLKAAGAKRGIRS